MLLLEFDEAKWDYYLVLSCGHLHRDGNQDGSELSVQISEEVCSREVSLYFYVGVLIQTKAGQISKAQEKGL